MSAIATATNLALLTAWILHNIVFTEDLLLLNRNGESEGWEFNKTISHSLLLDTRLVTASSALCFSMAIYQHYFIVEYT